MDDGIFETAYLSAHDEIILKELVTGVCAFRYLYEKFHVYYPSEHALRQRLAKLAKAGHIQSRLYGDPADGAKFALYVLGPAGIKYLTVNNHCRADEIRTLLPSSHTVAHELVVVDVVRRLQRESMHVPYDLKYYDDPTCRAHRKLLGLRAPIPDLLVIIELFDNPSNIFYSYRLNIEVHMGSMPVLDVVDKTLKQEHITLFLCSTQENLSALQGAMQRHEKLNGMVFFTTVYEFCTRPGGIFGTNFKAVDGRPVSLYP